MLQPKKSTTKKPNPIKKYKKTSSGDSLGEDIFEIMDPTGISSYDDVYRSYKDNGLLSWQTGLEILGALPIIGKAGKGIKIATTSSKYLKALSKTNKITAKAEKVLPAVLKAGKDFGKLAHKVARGGRANPIAAGAIGVGLGAEGLQKVTKIIEKTTKKGVKEIIKKTPANKRVINETVATVNSANTLSDVAGAVQNQVITPIKDNIVTPIASDIKEFIDKDSYKPITKTVYYNTDPKRGEVEKPGTKANVRYVPVSNSFQLKKWKEQKLAFGTGKDGIGDPPTRLAFENELMSKVITERNKDKNFVQRALNPSDYPAIINEDGSETTHLMGLSIDQEGNPYIMPTVIQNNLGLLQKLPDEDAAVEYAKKTGEGVAIPDIQLANYYTQNGLIKHGYGTNSQGIMKNKMNPRKKYANGSSAKGMNTNNYIISPAQALNDYNIMMAKVEAKAMSNPWLPIVGAIGGAAQSFVGNAGMYTKGTASIKPEAGDLLEKAIPKGLNIIASNSTGTVQAANGMNNVQSDVEVEGGERYETPQGQTGEFQGPSHAEGGIPLEVVDTPVTNPNQGEAEKGTIIYSKDLKIQGKSLADRQATREKQTAKLEKMASEPLVDKAIKNSLQRRMQAIQKEKMADLDFQEKVNNIQQMADTMVAAFGTGMAGIQDNPIGDSIEYGYGSGMNGVMKYEDGTGITGIDPITKRAYDSWLYASADELYKKYPKLKQGGLADDINVKKDFQTFLFKDKAGTKDADNNYSIDGDFGKTTNTFAKQYYDIYKDYKNQENLSYDMYPGWKGLDLPRLREGTYEAPDVKGAGGIEMDFPVPTTVTPTFGFKAPGIPEENYNYVKPQEVYSMGDAWKTMPEIPELVMSGKQGVESGGVSIPATTTTTAKTNSDEPTAMGNMMRGLPGMGDALKLFGNYLGMTAGIKTANEQRATDTSNPNVYRNVGEESQRLLDNAKRGIDINKSQAIVKANTNIRTGKKGARNSARGVNQMRAMDWLYDNALNATTSDIMAKAAEQMSAIDIQKSGVAMNADQLRGQGEWQATQADRADKDAYYTALALGRKDFATGMQQSGKDLNDMKENKIIENLMKQYGTYVTGDGSGNVSAKNKNSSKVSVTSEGGKTTTSKTGIANTANLSELLKSMNLTPDANGYITLPNGTKILEKDLLQKYSKQ
jgi:hypothetical protein